MVKKKKAAKPSHHPVFELQPKQAEYLSATQSVVFFGGGAK